jgi:hypothetical protein
LIVVFAGNERDGGGDSMLPEEPGAETKEGARGGGGAGAAFADPPDGGGVVGAAEDGGKRGHQGECEPELRYVAREFEVVDGEVAGGIGVRDEASGLGGSPFVAPEVGPAIWACEDAAHALAGCIVCPSPGRKIRNDLTDVGGSGSEGVE